MTTMTWEQLADLHGKIEIDALDFRVPAGADRIALVAGEFRQMFAECKDLLDIRLAAHLGFVLSDVGVTFTEESLRLAHVIHFAMIVSAPDEGEVNEGSLADILGFVDGKEIIDWCYLLGHAVDLVHALRGEPTGNRIADVTEDELSDIRARAHACPWRLAA